MSGSEDILEIFKKYWKTLLKWILRVHKLPEITVDHLYDRVNSSHPPLLIDIRPTEEFNGTAEDASYGHIPDAMSIPILELELKIEDLADFKEKEIVTLCPGGGLSLAAVEILTEAGFKDVKSLKVARICGIKKGIP